VLRLDRIRAEAGSNTIGLDRIPFGWIGYKCVDRIRSVVDRIWCVLSPF